MLPWKTSCDNVPTGNRVPCVKWDRKNWSSGEPGCCRILESAVQFRARGLEDEQASRMLEQALISSRL